MQTRPGGAKSGRARAGGSGEGNLHGGRASGLGQGPSRETVRTRAAAPRRDAQTRYDHPAETSAHPEIGVPGAARSKEAGQFQRPASVSNPIHARQDARAGICRKVSIGTPKTSAREKATSRPGAWCPRSIRFSVTRVISTRSASSSCVHPRAIRKRRTWWPHAFLSSTGSITSSISQQSIANATSGQTLKAPTLSTTAAATRPVPVPSQVLRSGSVALQRRSATTLGPWCTSWFSRVR